MCLRGDPQQHKVRVKHSRFCSYTPTSGGYGDVYERTRNGTGFGPNTCGCIPGVTRKILLRCYCAAFPSRIPLTKPVDLHQSGSRIAETVNTPKYFASAGHCYRTTWFISNRLSGEDLTWKKSKQQVSHSPPCTSGSSSLDRER